MYIKNTLSNSMLDRALTQFKEGDILRIYLMMPETKEFLEEKVMSHLEKED